MSRVVWNYAEMVLKIPRFTGHVGSTPISSITIESISKLIRLVVRIPHRANKYGERRKGMGHDEAYRARRAGALQCRGYEFLQRDVRLL